ncbi:hypothetical protein AMATHDRAFT_63008 [Amanita thiersii Skay4041]|uniref:Transmembrane protein n=1 Tax=Amanita thiersii Skay4041 TaxID=703135 RepID=A0A2A9NPD5_9AGAR|nr:hypothetical protein AMATHDRAFT_63008 [Amanita thiersii Skay4041]
MDAIGWSVALATAWAVASVPVVSAEKVCYTSFGQVVCKERLPLQARAAIWVTCLGVLVLIIGTILLVQRHRANRERDAIATIEASQMEGPMPTPFGSSFVQVNGPPPPVTYNVAPYGPRTAGVAPASAYTVNFTPRTPANFAAPGGGAAPTTARTPYASSQYPKTAELTPFVSRSYRSPGPGLPQSPRPHTPYVQEKHANNNNNNNNNNGSKLTSTPRDKNTRFVIPDLRSREVQRDWSERLEALRTAPTKRNFESVPSPTKPTQAKSATVVGTFPKLKPLFAGTGRSKDIF